MLRNIGTLLDKMKDPTNSASCFPPSQEYPQKSLLIGIRESEFLSVGASLKLIFNGTLPLNMDSI